ncbi:MAG: ABC transporter permease [Defluviitaleaceae bacterium]|nr:ABC transporter permease [Defluviitaleaceae bacterium]
MGNNIFTIMKKECLRIISDKKLLFMAVIMPGLLIFIMNSLMGNLIGGLTESDEYHIYQVHAVNMPESARGLLSQPELNINIIDIAEADVARVKQEITDRATDLLIVFPIGFDETVATFDPVTATALAPNIQIWANGARPASNEARSIVSGVLQAYHHALTHRFSINAPSEAAPDGMYDLATDADIFALVMGFTVPMMFLIFIFTGCQSLAPESISGEKERGTLGALLVTPAKRSDMALGKILSMSIFALVGAIGSIVGMIFSMPRMMGMDTGSFMEFYTFADLGMLFIVASTTTLVFVSALSVLSAYAKSVKEATAYSMPFMLISMVCGFASTILGGVPSESFFYMIPVFNSSLSLSAIINFEVSAFNMAITAAANILVSLVFTLALAKIFSSEKIVFS